MKTAVSLLFVLFLLFSQKGGILMGMEEKHIIRKMPMAHCKKGPQRCEICRSIDSSKFCLLRLCTPDGVQRRVTEVMENGRKVFREFEVERVFESEKDARVYALEHGIEDVPWENLPPAPGSMKTTGD